jgi:serine/threonine protein kinase
MSKVFTIAEGLENMGALRTGGQGSVYKGRRTGTIYTAIKMLPTPIYDESDEDKNYRNFQNEVAKLQKVNEQPNPNVVKILNSGVTESGSFPYIEMEYIEGPDLCELLQPPHEKIFTIKELIKLADQLAGALAHCHKVGVKHGDIKSNNVKYNIHSGNYVLLDFGLAILTDEQRRSSIRHAGAIEFMAPEQHDGQMLPQTDVYSYGIVLYELLTGQVPFPLNGSGETGRNNVMLAHIETEVPDALARRKSNMPANWTEEKRAQEMQVPAWLLQLIYKCLEKQPENRYANGVALQEAVVNGSISNGSNRVEDALTTTSLESENERLQAQLLQYQQANAEQQQKLSALQSLAIETGSKFNTEKGTFERNRRMVYVPKGLFMGVAAAAALFIVLFAYSFFNRNDATVSSSATTLTTLNKSYKSPYIYIKPYHANKAIVPSKIATAKDSVAKARKPIGKAKGRFKKKRKKFLGIF